MWGAGSMITFLGGFLFPPLWLLFIYFQIQEARKEGQNEEHARIRYTNLKGLNKSAPPECPSCGGHKFYGGIIRDLPAQGIRLMQFPMEGVVSVQNFTCLNCGHKGRYALPHARAEMGWVLLDRYGGGW